MGEYLQVEGVKTWFDSWGSGPPLVLMHGDMVTNATWESTAPALAEHFQVLAPERRAHGHTPDVEGALSYALLAQDTIGFMQEKVRGRADLVGWSGGGNVGLIVAMKRPDLVRKLVLISANFDVSGNEPAAFAGFASMTADGPESAFARSQYESTSPDGPEHWPAAFEKIKQMGMTDPTIEPKELGAVVAPTLVVAADDDVIRLEHTIELYRSIPNSQLAIVPGSSHALTLEKPDVINRLILDFLKSDPAPTLMPVRRAPAEG
jgi:pimeloyl-ACP methyl ester carboxylesterase